MNVQKHNIKLRTKTFISGKVIDVTYNLQTNDSNKH